MKRVNGFPHVPISTKMKALMHMSAHASSLFIHIGLNEMRDCQRRAR
jgi:hypothetical protein